jgi:hypothetical protein
VRAAVVLVALEEDEEKAAVVSRRRLIRMGVVKSGGTGIHETPPIVAMTAAEPTILL